MIIKVNDSISMELTDQQHAQELFALVNQNRSHLRLWLPWVDKMRSYQQFLLFITDSKKRAAGGDEFGCVIRQKRILIGRAGIYNIDKHMMNASLGYWLSAAWQGKGIVTGCCHSLINYAFTKIGLETLEIRCATNNLKSQAIAGRLQFRQSGLIKRGEFLNRRFIDLYVYTLQKKDWLNKQDLIFQPC